MRLLADLTHDGHELTKWDSSPKTTTLVNPLGELIPHR